MAEVELDITWEEIEEQREANESKEAEANKIPKTRKYI